MSPNTVDVAHVLCLERQNATVRKHDASEPYDASDPVQWTLQNMQPYWPCSICGRRMDDPPCCESHHVPDS